MSTGTAHEDVVDLSVQMPHLVDIRFRWCHRLDRCLSCVCVCVCVCARVRVRACVRARVCACVFRSDQCRTTGFHVTSTPGWWEQMQHYDYLGNRCLAPTAKGLHPLKQKRSKLESANKNREASCLVCANHSVPVVSPFLSLCLSHHFCRHPLQMGHFQDGFLV